MDTLIRLGALAATVLLLEMLLPGVRVERKRTALIVAVVFSLLNVLGGWLIAALLVLPALLSFGLLFLVYPLLINVVLLWVTDLLIKDFELKSAKPLWLSAGIITLVNGLVHAILRQV
ncbi:MAG: phage holin family protein [Myxococcales bacterium]|nr:phage holin family protein [Myxococcales bacterium]